MAALTQTNGLLANRFRDIVAPYFDPFYSAKVVNDYSGAFKNPYWGPYGCTLFFGGGHAGTNDNMVAIAEYGATAITFRRVCDPTPWFGSGTDSATRNKNSVGNANALMDLQYMESTIDGKPGAPHSYGSGDIVGPEYGGAANGTFLRVLSAAVNCANDAGAVAAHELRFDDTTTASSQRRWTRVTNEVRTTRNGWMAPHLTAFVGPQQRVYIQTNDSTPNVRWFDRGLKTWVTGSGRTFAYDYADGYDSGIMFYVPARGLLLCLYPRGGKLQVQWMDVSVAQPTLGGTATLTHALAVSNPWSAACWCPHNHRIIVAGVTADSAAAYEIEIPADLARPWQIARAPFGNGQTFSPADAKAGIGITYKKFHYDEKVRAIVYTPLVAGTSGDETVWVYRPRST